MERRVENKEGQPGENRIEQNEPEHSWHRRYAGEVQHLCLTFRPLTAETLDGTHASPPGIFGG